MPVVMKGSWFFAEPGGRAFKVASNFTNYLELGSAGITTYYLEARIEKTQFVVNALLPDAKGQSPCRIVDNFPQKSECQRKMLPNGYRILSQAGDFLFGIEVRDNICHLRGKIYDGN